MPAAAAAADLRSRYGPWAVIAGGSEGIGASFARQLAAAGLDLVLIARRAGPLEALAARVEQEYGRRVRTLRLDLCAADAGARVAAGAGDLEVGLLVYNAGATRGYGRFVDWSVEDLDAMIALDCRTPVHLAHHFGRAMCDRGRGGLLFMSSMAAFCGAAHISIYPAAKAFQQTLAEGLWLDLAPAGVDVLCLVAGATKTPSHAHVDFSQLAPGLPDGGAMECDAVAREGLARLGQGPLWVAGERNRALLPPGFLEGRGRLVEAASAATARLQGLETIGRPPRR